MREQLRSLHPLDRAPARVVDDPWALPEVRVVDPADELGVGLLVEFPRPGSWTIAFLTGTPAASIAPYLPGEHVSVYVPTTPNPTGGYFLMLPRSQVRELDMTVDEALKYIISMGVVAPRGTVVPAPAASPRPVAAGGAPASIADSRN